MNQNNKVEFRNGVLTPALRAFVDSLFAKITRRYDYSILQNVKGEISFEQILQKERAGKYIQFSDLQADIEVFLSAGKESEDSSVKIVIADIEQKISKELSLIQKLSDCQFKDVTTECVDSLMKALEITQLEINVEREKFEQEKQQLLDIRRSRILQAIEKDSPNREIPVIIP